MNQTHIHLLITHLPIFGSILGGLVLASSTNSGSGDGSSAPVTDTSHAGDSSQSSSNNSTATGPGTGGATGTAPTPPQAIVFAATDPDNNFDHYLITDQNWSSMKSLREFTTPGTSRKMP